MENIEQLKADNVKLTERLNNAAKFFREQKAQIEALTKENEELKGKPKDDYVSPEKWNALVTEKEDLNEQLKDKDVEIINQKDALQSCYTQLHDYEIMNDSLNKEKENLNEQLNEYELKLQASEKSYAELKELHDGDLKRYNELENNYEGLQNKYKDLKDLYDGEINRFNEQQSAYDNSITLLEEKNIKLEKDVYNLETNYEGLQNKYNDLDKEFESLKNNVDEQENELIKNWREKYNREVQEKEALKTFIKENYDKFQKYLQELQNELVQKFKDNSDNNQHPNKSTMVLNSTGNQFMSDAPGLNI